VPRRTLAAQLATPLVAGLLSVLTAAPAAADDHLVLRDASGDMWRADAVGEAVPAPASTLGDLRRVDVRHGSANVVVTLRFVDLRRAGSYANYTVRLQTGVRTFREVTLEADRHSWAGSTRVFRHGGNLVRGCGESHRVDYRGNTVRIVLPRSCLGTPRFVRANVNVYRADAEDAFFSDNPHDGQAESGAWTRWLRTSAAEPSG
jgi:hypothetical protein